MKGRIVAAGLALGLLAGCDGDFDFDSGLEADFAARLAENEAMVARLEAGTAPDAGQMASLTGSVAYTGTAGLRLDTAGTSELAGLASLEADFDSDSWSGELTDFIGRLEDGEVQAFSGSLALGAGTIGGGSNPASELNGTLAGLLTGTEGDTVAVNGGVTGNFVNLAPLLAAGLLLEDRAGTGYLLNGAAVDGTLGVAAER